MEIHPLHEVRDEKKLSSIISSMDDAGLNGRPVIVLNCGDYYQALTGTHRLAAAAAAGIDPKIIVIDQPVLTDDEDSLEISELFQKLIEEDDVGRLAAMVALCDLGEVEEDVVQIMEEEI